ncbi:large subunit ribosomal protein L4 [Acetoanaerobium noterae]|jgi:large subunit ribosomal protein L4|uniref:Large ribosomal subunit protein uL4 n=1 Tax=Acetoanaerobium noterae TaxID=745369 RepID=A0A1T5DBM8_9FIRM|nr:50S ribosomal protein L4 [Acetoanaerobium noterae]MDK2804466.1 large subunit ribosomal protein [Peptostreptococcaceae bacterium]SKB69124.1 large subunit ribosomal protein L4 [Acetoanaerobium noterae]
MPKVDVLNINGQKVEELELSESIFAAEISEYAVYEVIKNHLANRRQGTQSAKTRAEVRGGGRKPWRQKGTGRARQGSTRSPQWIGGGVVFAPKPRDYSYSVNKKVRRLALKSVLTTKVNEGNLIVLDALEMNAPKTKDFIAMLSAVNAGKKALVVTAENSPNVVKSGRNIPGVDITFVNTLNVYDIMRHDSLIITKEAVRKTEEVYA